MKHLALTPDRNTPPDNDFTGAFDPEARRYDRYWVSQGDIVARHAIDVSAKRPARRDQVLSLIAVHGPIDRLAIFCHGWMTGIQLGFELAQVPALCVALAKHSTPDLKVALYCCSTGRSAGPPGDGGDGSFADTLRDGLVAAGRPLATVFSHTSAGHTTRSAAVRLFVSDGAKGGHDLAAVGTRERERLKARLDDSNDALRWRLPYLPLDVARSEIA